MSPRFFRLIFPVGLITIALLAMVILNIATPVGAGLANDSVAYIAGARSILQGTGYSDIWLDSPLEAITHYPPLYSLSLAGIGRFGIDPLRGARVFNIFLFGANTLLMGLLGWRATRSRFAGLWLAGLFMLNAALIRVHIFALSEGLYLCLSMLAFLCMDLYFSRKKKSADYAEYRRFFKTILVQGVAGFIRNYGWLFITGLLSGLAFLTRYSALAMLPTFVITLLLFHTNWKTRLTSTGFFMSGAIPPIAAWFLRNKIVAGNATNRTFQFHLFTAENIQPGIYNFSQFLIPYEPWRQVLFKSGWLSWALAVFALILLGCLANSCWKMVFYAKKLAEDTSPRKQTRSSATTEVVTTRSISFNNVLYSFGYLGAILFSMSFFDASTKLQPRILAPLFTAFLLILVTFGAWLWQQANSKAGITPGTSPGKIGEKAGGKIMATVTSGVAVCLVLLSLSLSGVGCFKALNEFKTTGLGYASWKWHDSLIMENLRKQPAGMIIYTNTPPAVYLVTGRASRTLPTAFDPVDNLARSDFGKNIAEMRKELLSGKAILALFDITPLPASTDVSLSEEAPKGQKYDKFIAGLTIIKKAQGDVIYGVP